MSQPRTAEPAKSKTGLARLFDSEKFRRRTIKVYRIAGPVALAYFALTFLQSFGLLGSLSADKVPQWLLMAYALTTFGLALATPILFILASVGGLALKADWRFSMPLWLFSFGSGLFLVTVFLVKELTLSDQQQVWNTARLLLLISAAWATAVGYRR